MAKSKSVVHVVDDDAAVRDALRWLLSSVKLTVRAYPSAQIFLKTYKPSESGCVLLDVRMPEISGLELQQELNRLDIDLPVIIITGHGDVNTAVRAMKAGAFDFIEKPFNDQAVIDSVQAAVTRSIRQSRKRGEERELAARLNSLTAREKEILRLIVTGKSGKAISFALKLSQRTVEFHRANIMRKLAVRSVAELASMAVSTTLG